MRFLTSGHAEKSLRHYQCQRLTKVKMNPIKAAHYFEDLSTLARKDVQVWPFIDQAHCFICIGLYSMNRRP